jgi:hypothetical protein
LAPGPPDVNVAGLTFGLSKQNEGSRAHDADGQPVLRCAIHGFEKSDQIGATNVFHELPFLVPRPAR